VDFSGGCSMREEEIGILWARRVPSLKHIGIMHDAMKGELTQPVWMKVARDEPGEEAPTASVRRLSTEDGRHLTQSFLDMLFPSRHDWPSINFR
jgi:hypothetical protein